MRDLTFKVEWYIFRPSDICVGVSATCGMFLQVVLLDECSQMTEPLSLLPVKKACCSRLILVGDPRVHSTTLRLSHLVSSSRRHVTCLTLLPATETYDPVQWGVAWLRAGTDSIWQTHPDGESLSQFSPSFPPSPSRPTSSLPLLFSPVCLSHTCPMYALCMPYVCAMYALCMPYVSHDSLILHNASFYFFSSA